MIGHQQHADWMGATVLTLADLWPDEPRAAVVGINPAPTSVALGHYYQGQAGQRQMRRLQSAEFLPGPEEGRHLDDVAFESGVAFTDIVKRPTVSAKDVSPDEFHFGRARIREALAIRRVRVIICVFKAPVVALLGGSDGPGLQGRLTDWGASVFQLPGPYSPKAAADSIMSELRSVVEDSSPRADGRARRNPCHQHAPSPDHLNDR